MQKLIAILNNTTLHILCSFPDSEEGDRD